MSLLVETLKVEDGNVLNISYHNDRMLRSLYMIYGIRTGQRLENIIIVPESALNGVFKCRVIYNDKTFQVEFLPYILRPVNSLKLVHSDEICYPYKYIDRTRINRLFEQRGDCDDILIIKNGMVTDSSYANVIFRDFEGNWVTPASFLLPGTKRAALLHQGLIAETTIGYSDINNYSEAKLINSMIEFGIAPGIPVKNILSF
jgi:4-amino-4-deoxychorismate lyase